MNGLEHEKVKNDFLNLFFNTHRAHSCKFSQFHNFLQPHQYGSCSNVMFNCLCVCVCVLFIYFWDEGGGGAEQNTLPVCLYVCMSVCLSVCLSVCMSVCVSVCMSVSHAHTHTTRIHAFTHTHAVTWLRSLLCFVTPISHISHFNHTQVPIGA